MNVILYKQAAARNIRNLLFGHASRAKLNGNDSNCCDCNRRFLPMANSLEQFPFQLDAKLSSLDSGKWRKASKKERNAKRATSKTWPNVPHRDMCLYVCVCAVIRFPSARNKSRSKRTTRRTMDNFHFSFAFINSVQAKQITFTDIHSRGGVRFYTYFGAKGKMYGTLMGCKANQSRVPIR